MQVDLAFPCICGCLAGDHAMHMPNLCKFCFNESCDCYDFRPDNLKYLEMKTNSK